MSAQHLQSLDGSVLRDDARAGELCPKCGAAARAADRRATPARISFAACTSPPTSTGVSGGLTTSGVDRPCEGFESRQRRGRSDGKSRNARRTRKSQAHRNRRRPCRTADNPSGSRRAAGMDSARQVRWIGQQAATRRQALRAAAISSAPARSPACATPEAPRDKTAALLLRHRRPEFVPLKMPQRSRFFARRCDR